MSQPPQDWGPHDPAIFGEPEPPPKRPPSRLMGFAIGFAIVVPMWLAVLCIYEIFRGGIWP